MSRLQAIFGPVVLVFVALLMAGRTAAQQGQPQDVSNPAPQAHSNPAYGKLPLSFEANEGQSSPTVKFLSRGRGYTLLLTSTEAFLALAKPGPGRAALGQGRPHRPAIEPRNKPIAEAIVRMGLIGASPEARVQGMDELPGKVNYFIGNDPKKWRTNLPTYASIRYHDIYPGIDLVYYGNQGRLEYDFVVAPGADPRAVRFAVGGADALRVGARGNLALQVSGREVLFEKPEIYQKTPHGRKRVAGEYALSGQNRVSFSVGKYDRTKPLIIDPRISYSTYLGGGDNEFSSGIAVDIHGAAYIAGTTFSSNFPTTAGAFQTSLTGVTNVFVSKLSPDGTALVYSTYLGGTGSDDALSIAVDPFLSAYVTGTAEENYPTTSGAFQTSLAGGVDNTFVTKLDFSGSSLVYSTYLGPAVSYGSGGKAIAIDSPGNAYVTGTAPPAGFSTTVGAAQSTCSASQSCGFVRKLNPQGTGLVYSTYLSGSDGNINEGDAIAVDPNGDAYVGGTTNSDDLPTTAGSFQSVSPKPGGVDFPTTGYAAELNPAGSALLYSTYFGGSVGSDTASYDGESIGGIAIDSAGNATVTGKTASTNFPLTRDAFQKTFSGAFNDAFVSKLNSSGSALIYSTYLGGGTTTFEGSTVKANNVGRAVVVDFSQAYVTGFTDADNFPTLSPIQAARTGGANAFVTTVNTEGGTSVTGLVFSTYLGGSGNDQGEGIALDAVGNLYVTGQTDSTNFPTTEGAFQTAKAGNSGFSDAFITKISFVAPTVVSVAVASQEVQYGIPVTLVAMVGSGGQTPTGTVTFYDGSTLLGTAPVNGGQAAFAISSLAAGLHSISAVYSGDSTFLAGTSALLSQAVAQAPLTITANGATKILDAANPAFTPSYSGFANGDSPASLSGSLVCTTTAATNSSVGSYPINCTGQSSGNYSITYVPGTLKIFYASGGNCDGSAGHVILPPVNADGSSVYNQGRTVPAQFRVCDANGVSVGTAGVVSSFYLTAILTGTSTVAVQQLADTNNPDTAFRWDPTNQQWIFNISTQNLAAGSTYVYTVALNDGTAINFQYGLR